MGRDRRQTQAEISQAVLWVGTLIGMPLAIPCLILAGFEFKYVYDAAKLSRIQAAERARPELEGLVKDRESQP